ncbi:hypothetical protein DFA_04297 [Cavenderia fasciculata]|uniref:Ankyrin repeat-containing protein n=1 Tax=Cavenderia fasciculata TaxID=261658 RepID=F4PP66_CACFS|nr:uncharacterized protein DFA_04297 [Cavenderia fasciculata]EGG22179.1 hypothetical protein DFA_04297 [Cavenderia fasciculata]|eukprot:XP_004360030.1 hypothetical protein DFA_04297 [Cavenderia fasciculata]
MITTTTSTSTTTFHSILKVQYIRHLIFNHVSDISNNNDNSSSKLQHQHQRSPLKGRDIINLPRLEMISIYGMRWDFIRHYLPKDIKKIVFERRRRVITQYCQHPNATLDTLLHLLEWSYDIEFDWQYLNSKINAPGVRIRNQEILEYLIKQCKPKEKYYFFIGEMSKASKDGDLSIVKHLHFNRTEGAITYAMDMAAENGHLNVFRFLDQHRTEGHSSAMDLAAFNGHVEIIKYIHEHRSEGAVRTMDFAARFGHLNVVQFLHDHRTEGASTDAMDKASQNGHFEIVKFLHFNRSEGATKDAMDYACARGYIDIVQFLHEHRNEGCTTKAMDKASQNGHFEIVKYLHFNRTEGATTDAMDYACAGGYIDIVQFLYQHRSEGATPNSISLAGDYSRSTGWKNLETLNYLINTVNIQCQFPSTISLLLHNRGDQYVFQNFLFLYNLLSNNINNINNINNNNNNNNPNNPNNNNNHILTSDMMDTAAENGHIEIVKFLHEHSSEGATTWAMDTAAGNGYIEIVKFLHEHRTEGCTSDAMDRAARNGHIEIVKFLHYNRSEGQPRFPNNYESSKGYLEMVSFMIDIGKLECNQDNLRSATFRGSYEIVKLILDQFGDRIGKESIKQVIDTYKPISDHFEVIHLLESYLNPPLTNRRKNKKK